MFSSRDVRDMNWSAERVQHAHLLQNILPASCAKNQQLTTLQCKYNQKCKIILFLIYGKNLHYEGKKFELRNFRDVLLQQSYGAYLREVKRWAIPRGPSEQRGLWVAPLWRPVYASACRWGATQAAGLPGLGSLTNPFYQLTQDPTPCWVLFYTVLIWRNRPSAIQNTLQTQHNTYSCLHTHTLTATRQADTTVACWGICTLWKQKKIFLNAAKI